MIFRYDDYARCSSYDADVIVVGTGAGGASAGAELADAGLAVLFIEEGSYHPTASFNPFLSESIPRLYRNAGINSIIGTPNIPFTEGRCVGGSTVVNSGVCHRAPENVLVNWERATADDSLGPAGLAPVFEHVERRISVYPQSPGSIGDDNRIMYLGARRLGWKSEISRRAQSHCVGANNCILGCPTGAKQSTLVSYMPRALQAGARCLTEVRVNGLIIEGGRCVGVRGRAWNPRTRRPDRSIVARSKAVILACGAIQTPHLLLKHRLGLHSGQIGRNFLCHPNAKVLAVYPFDVKAWQGVSQWTQVREFQDEGMIFAENFIPPGPLAGALPWSGSKSLEMVKRYNQMLMTGVQVEDSTAGRVVRGPFDMPLARYDITDWDFDRFIRGVERLSLLHFEMGAEQVILPFRTMHVAHSIDEVRKITRSSMKKRQIELFAIHLMGTARLGASPQGSVVDLNHQLWHLPGCYVSDASVFPSAIGVNPQVTIMALSTRMAHRLADRLLRQRASGALTLRAKSLR